MNRSFYKIMLRIMAVLSVLLCSLNINAEELDDFVHINITVKNMLTDYYVRDTLTVDLLKPDSTFIMSAQTKWYGDDVKGWSDARFTYKTEDSDFLVRLSHPDYETIYYKIHVDKDKKYRSGKKEVTIRKLTKSEKARMLDEVVVTASVVEFVHKGDTLQFNADAFELAEGSMLSALIKRLPGAELRDNGQIYVNGRFVDKLLLDGKDFFRNDKLVLLQNLPAYTVKNIQVYEQNSAAQLMEKGSSKPDYVMDVKLKKGFNAGWLANAEAGGGTHSRYRLRGFGLLYNNKSRFSLYALGNNLNETGSPDMSGSWNDPSNNKNEIITKGAGMDYFLEPNSKVAFNGDVTAQYQTVFSNTMVNRQNYLPDGNNYSRRWNDSHAGNLSLSTSHTANIKTVPFLGLSTQHIVSASFGFSRNKDKSRITEGTFGSLPGRYPSLRDELLAFMPDTLDILNRYLSFRDFKSKRASGSLNYQFITFLKKTYLGLTLFGDMSHGWGNGSEHYLMQYSGQAGDETLRTNPKNSHSYRYGAKLMLHTNVGKIFMMPNYSITNSYDYNSTRFYDAGTDSISGVYDIWRLRGRMRQLEKVLDTRNSYTTGLHELDQRLEWTLVYEKAGFDDQGWKSRMFRVDVTPKLRYARRSLLFHGMTPQTLRKNSLLPGVNALITYMPKDQKNKMMLNYELSSALPAMMDMVDMQFNSDPMNPTVGNPDLKYSTNHKFRFIYDSQCFFWDKLLLQVQIDYNRLHNSIAYSSSYDLATGIRTTRPVNINGNQDAQFILVTMLKPDRRKRMTITNVVNYSPGRLVNEISTDAFSDSRRSVSHRNGWWDQLTAEYKTDRFTVGFTGDLSIEHMTSKTGDFSPYTLKQFRYGVRGLVRLPWNVEVSTNLRMYSYRGYSDPAMNNNQLIWNARITKSVLNGSLQFAFDGYDMLRQCKKTGNSITSSYREEIRYNYIPSYFMFTVKYFFAKKPRH